MIAARRAGAALALAAWAVPFVWLALPPDTGVRPFFGSLALVYLVGAGAIAAGWFWARWFAVGIGWWGVFAGISLMLVSGVGPLLLGFSLSHAALVGLLHGAPLVAAYEGRPEWRERWQLDDQAASKIGGLVTNLGTLLPMVAFYAFFPRGGGGAAATVAALLAGAGTIGLFRMRTWGLLAIASAGVILLLSPSATACGGGGGWLLGALLLLATLRFAPEVARWFRAPR